MKKTILFICSLLTSFSFCQDFKLVKASDHIEAIANHKLENKPNIFITDFNDLDTLIKRSKKKYKIVYYFSGTCPSSTETFPSFIEFLNENDTLFELFTMVGHRYSEIPHYIEYSSRIKYFNPIYILDMEKYGKRKNPSNRIRKLNKTLCKECDYKRMGASNFFVVDENNNIIVVNDYYFSWDQQLNQLKQLIKTET